MKSNLDVRAKLHRAKEQLRKYKEKARSFYRQLTFASWARDSVFHVGYMGGIKTFRAWVRKPKNFSKVDTISVGELLPFLNFFFFFFFLTMVELILVSNSRFYKNICIVATFHRISL